MTNESPIWINGETNRVHLYVIRHVATTSDGVRHNLRWLRDRAFAPSVRVGSLLHSTHGLRRVVALDAVRPL